MADAHNKLVDLTRRDLGEAYTAQLRQWRDTYAAVLEVYRDETLSKDDKLRLFESHFASLFIDKQPALPLMRFWREQVQKMPDAPPDVPTYSAAMLEYEPPTCVSRLIKRLLQAAQLYLPACRDAQAERYSRTVTRGTRPAKDRRADASDACQWRAADQRD